MAGVWHLSNQQVHDANGKPIAGARAVFQQAESLTALTVYQDYGLGTEHPAVVESDDNGIWPVVFFDEADEFYRFRTTTPGGTTLIDLTTMPIIGPSGGGGGSEVPVDEDALAATGDIKFRHKSGTISGWVRCNGRTIGNGASGGTERANADTEALFTYLYDNFSDTICPVIGGRGASAAVDYAANKAITLFNMRGVAPFGLNDMGGSDSGAIAAGFITTGNGTTGGSSGGADGVTIAKVNVPSYALDITALDVGGSITTNETTITDSVQTNVNLAAGGGSRVNLSAGGTTPTFDITALTVTGTLSSGGSGTEVNKMPPFILGTWYIRL